MQEHKKLGKHFEKSIFDKDVIGYYYTCSSAYILNTGK